MKKVVFIILLFPLVVFSQNKIYFQQTDLPKFLNSNGDTLLNAMAGGVVNPQLSNIDLNGDGILDLFVFDRFDNKVLTFLNNGKSLIYAPQYEALFPKLYKTALLVDYNGDGKEDIFAYSTTSPSSIEVYKNVSDTEGIKFQKVTEELQAQFKNFRANIGLLNTDIPAITDVDQDGDIDIVTFSDFGGFIKYYKNVAVENGYSSDSLSFVLASNCWGKVTEGSLSSDLELGKSCGKEKRDKHKHTGSTLLLFDEDGDGDKDLVIGDIGFRDLIFAKNGKVETHYHLDSMIAWNHEFPEITSGAFPIDLPYFPGAFLVDINNDGKKDIVASPQQPIGQNKNLNQVWYYKNNGSASNPNFVLADSSFLQDGMIDLGSYTAPAFTDYDHDGDMDLFVATHGEYIQTNNLHDRIFFYENIGDSINPVFELKDPDFLGFSNKDLFNITLAFGDVDSDGDDDLVMGYDEGRIAFIENVATKDSVADYKIIDLQYDSLWIGNATNPALVDLNKDGLADLVVGETAGNLNYYRTKMTNGKPDFIKVTDSLGKLNHSEYANTSPAFADFNGDGKLDMVIGADMFSLNYEGKLTFFYDIESNLNGKFQASDSFIYEPELENAIPKFFGSQLKPAVADLNGDSIPDILLGNKRGGLMFLEGTDTIEIDTSGQTVGVAKKNIDPLKVKIYPNPAGDVFYIDFVNSPKESLELKVYNVFGLEKETRIVKATTQKIALNIADFQQGTYIIRIRKLSGEVVNTSKILIMK